MGGNDNWSKNQGNVKNRYVPGARGACCNLRLLGYQGVNANKIVRKHDFFSHAYDAVKENPEVTMRLGSPLKAFGHDHGGRREGRRNIIDKDEFKDEKGNDVVRIKFVVQGPRGKRHYLCRQIF